MTILINGSERRWSVIVVGAGPAGSVASLLFSRLGLRVLLLDRYHFPRDKTCGDGLTPRALEVLDRIGILPGVDRLGYPLQGMSFRTSLGRTCRVDLSLLETSRPYSIVVPRLQLDNYLLDCAVRAGVTVKAGVEVAQLMSDRHVVNGVRTVDGDEFRAALIVVATGADRSLLRDFLPEINAFKPDVAARAYFGDMNGLSNALEFMFEASILPGYLWLFPTSSTSANIGVYLKGGTKSSPRTVLKNFLERSTTNGWPQIGRQLSPIKSYPLRTDFPFSRKHIHGLCVIGETAGLVNPLTGEGIDVSLETAEKLVSIVGPTLASAGTPGNATADYMARLYYDYANTQRYYRFLRALMLSHPWVVNRGIRAIGHSVSSQKAFLTLFSKGTLPPFSTLLNAITWFVHG